MTIQIKLRQKAAKRTDSLAPYPVEGITSATVGTASISLSWVNPQDIDSYNDIGLSYHYIGRSDEGLNYLEEGIKKFEELKLKIKDLKISGSEAFDLYQSFGFPLEMTVELAKESGLSVDIAGFNDEMKKHQELSRADAEQKFKGGLADTSEISTKYHTATHLLLAALNKVLGEGIYQRGSNITAERLRFDFNWPEKLTTEQIKAVEDLVNEKIKADLPVVMTEMPKDGALKEVKVSFDPSKYPDMVKVYKIGEFSVELCGGPHVEHIGVLGKFRIAKEEASSSGVRRIKAMLE